MMTMVAAATIVRFPPVINADSVAFLKASKSKTGLVKECAKFSQYQFKFRFIRNYFENTKIYVMLPTRMLR